MKEMPISKNLPILLLIFLTSSFITPSSAEAQVSGKKDKNWHDQIYRKLFFDYHNHSGNWGLAENFNAGKWAEQLKAADAQGVSVFAKCAQGLRYYRKGNIGWVHPEMPAGLDMLGEQIDACHKRDIKVIAYYHTFGSSTG